MGTVWRAVQLGTRREVALKLLASGVFSSDKARMRFEREVELAARLPEFLTILQNLSTKEPKVFELGIAMFPAPF
jgi:serine/threonine protein kinase